MKNKKGIIYIISIIVALILLFSLYYFSGVFKYDKKVELNANEKYIDKVKVQSFFRDATNELEKEGNVDITKLGKYKVIYKFKTKIGITKKIKVEVNVVDKEAPKIELIGGDKIEVFLEDKYKELGYNVKDNYDKNVKVEIEGNVDTNKSGSYYLVYKAKDSSGNKSEVVRKVTVERKSPLSMNIEQFNLDNYFEGTILKESKVMSDDYLNNMVFAGDSVPWQFGLNKAFEPSRVWAKPCEGPYNFDTQKVYVNNVQTNYTLANLIETNKPKYLTLHMGVCDTNSDNVETFITSYGKAIDYIKEVSPDTKLIVMSLMPQTGENLSWIPLRNNSKLNKYNYYLAELCSVKGVKFLNAATSVKDSSGKGDSSLFFDDGYHPNVTGMRKILDYINNHGYVE